MIKGFLRHCNIKWWRNMKLKSNLTRIIIAVFVYFAFSVFTTSFAADPSQKINEPKVDLISSVEKVDPQKEKEIFVGIKFDLPEGYDTYWKWSNGLGKPLTITWKKDENIKNIEIQWPLPKKMTVLGYEVYAYKGTVVFPLKITTNQLEKPIDLDLHAEYVICTENDCHAYDKDFRLNIPTGTTEYSPNKGIIDAFLQQVPVVKNIAMVDGVNTFVSYKGEKEYYNVIVQGKNAPLSEVFIMPTDPISIGSIERIVKSGENKVTFKTEIERSDKAARALEKTEFTVVVSSPDKSVEFVDNERLSSGFSSLKKILTIFLSGFLGGILLNLMPCVLPVLMLKVLDVVHSTEKEYRYQQMGYLLSGFGILFTFMLFSLITIILKTFGEMASWGMHFQEPMYLISLALLLTLFSCNLCGFFELFIPAVSFLSVELRGMLGSFFNGVAITLLGIPCTAPFLGTGISYGLTQPTVVSVLIFFAIGLGFSLPYFVMGSSQHLTMGMKKIMPKPGMWMVRIKQIVGVILGITVAWIVWILSAMISTQALIAVAMALIFIVALLYFSNFKPEKIRNAGWGAVCVLILASFIVVHQNEVKKDINISDGWVKFSPAMIEAAVAENKIVFVDFTAKWCLTCKFNEKFVLDSPEIQKILKQPNVVAMKADWTNQDPEISKFLKSFNQYAIPCYIVFSPKHPEGYVLNAILKKNDVTQHLSQ